MRGLGNHLIVFVVILLHALTQLREEMARGPVVRGNIDWGNMDAGDMTGVERTRRNSERP